MPVSIIVRSLNESKQLAKLYPLLKAQEYSEEIQLIQVDNESSDDSVKVGKSFGAKIVHLPRHEFSYPKSMNLGVEAAKHELVVLLVAHAYPMSKNWLADGTSHFANKKVAAVYANQLPYEGASLVEQAFYYPHHQRDKRRGAYPVKPSTIGIMSATNCIIRRSLWKKHPFDLRYGLGGEDGEWARWAISKGYDIINDHRFVVRHSHGLNFKNFHKQLRLWRSLSKPQPYDRSSIEFRDDLSFD